MSPTAKEYTEFTLGAKQAFDLRSTSKLGLKTGICNMLCLTTDPTTSALFTPEAAEALCDSIINESRILRAKNDADSLTGHEIDPALRALLFSVPGVASPAIVPPRTRTRRVTTNAQSASAAPAAAGGPPVAPASAPARNVRPRLDVHAELERLGRVQQQQATRIEQVRTEAREDVNDFFGAAQRDITAMGGRIDLLTNGNE